MWVNSWNSSVPETDFLAKLTAVMQNFLYTYTGSGSLVLRIILILSSFAVWGDCEILKEGAKKLG